MFKQSHVHKAFNKRFFALYNRIMVYYEKENEFLRDASRGTFEVGVHVTVCMCVWGGGGGVRERERDSGIHLLLFLSASS